MEKMILGKLEWYLTVPTPYVFLVRYIKASVASDNEVIILKCDFICLQTWFACFILRSKFLLCYLQMENLVFFLAELGLVQYNTVVKYRPSVIAASAVYAARCTLNRSPFWSDTLGHYTGYSEDQLMYV